MSALLYIPLQSSYVYVCAPCVVSVWSSTLDPPSMCVCVCVSSYAVPFVSFVFVALAFAFTIYLFLSLFVFCVFVSVFFVFCFCYCCLLLLILFVYLLNLCVVLALPLTTRKIYDHFTNVFFYTHPTQTHTLPHAYIHVSVFSIYQLILFLCWLTFYDPPPCTCGQQCDLIAIGINGHKRYI